MGETVSCEVLIIGGGPAGMAAARTASEHADVLLIDENPLVGGQIFRAAKGALSPEVSRIAPLETWQRASVRTGLPIYDLDPVRGFAMAGNGLRIEFRRVVLTSGARELLLPFPGWTLPGVFGAGGLQALAKQGMFVRGRRIVVAGTGPLLLAVAKYLDDAGGEVLRIFEQAHPVRLRSMAKTMWRFPSKAIQALGYTWTAQSMRPGWWVRRAIGSDRLEAVEATNGVNSVKMECDLLAIGYGLVPNLELARLAGCRVQNGFVAVDEHQQTSVPGIYCAGEPTGIGGLEKAEIEGAIAGFAASGRPGEAARLLPARQKTRAFMREIDRAFALRPEVLTLAEDSTLICRCEDVPYAAVKNCVSFRETKLHTRLGMGPCQGRICGAACHAMLGWESPSVRPPLVPVKVSEWILD